MADNRVSYLNKTFETFKANLINYAKTYFPNTYNDFSDANPGALFIEMASYIGDVTSFYTDTQIQETFLLHAKEKPNLYALSYMLGYRPKVSYASNVVVDIYQLIPSKTDPVTTYLVPDYDYAVIVPENTVISSASTGIKFLTIDKVDFTDTTNTEITTVDSNYFLLKKQVKAISAEIKSTTLSFSSLQKFTNVDIEDENILQILDAEDVQGNKWYEVPYLAQSTILNKITNPNAISDGVSYLVDYQRVPRRFVSRFLSNGTLQLEFGAGISTLPDSVILPTPDNIQLGLIPGISNLLNEYNQATPFFTQEYGLAPSSDIIVRYLVGGGMESNVASNDITIIDRTGIYFPSGITSPINPNPSITPLTTYVINSVICNNPFPASGGRGGDEVEEIRNNALYAYQSQLRAVTREDYMVRALSLPTDHGSIAKVYVTQDVASEMMQSQTVSYTEERNPLSLDMYILAYNSDKKLITASNTLKQNLATYINQYRMVTDAINIKDAFYINIGINFDVIVQSGYNNNDVITNCIIALQDHFNIDKWTINQPIIISDIMSALLKIKGVQSVTKIEIVNKQDNAGTTYSPYAYDIIGATRQGNIYPSMDPSIFEVRYPNTDIQGRVVPFVI
jgi:hypothetical protein